MERAVANAKELGIFIVFLILDNPKNKDSILDIRFPVFKSDGSMPEIKSYIEEFPFPFYVLLRDINALPTVLSDALKQWFELVTQGTWKGLYISFMIKVQSHDIVTDTAALTSPRSEIKISGVMYAGNYWHSTYF